jgi:hypothetical protein
MGVYPGRRYVPPVGSGTSGHHTAAAPGGGKDSSVTSVTVQKGVYRGRRYTAPVGSGTAGRDIAAVLGGGTLSRVATNLVGQTAILCGPRTRQGIGPDQLPSTDRKRYHARRGKRPNSTQIRTKPSPTYGRLGGRRNTAAGSPAIAGRIVSSTGGKINTHGEGSDELPRTEAFSYPRHTGVAYAAGAWRPGPTVYGECSFRLNIKFSQHINLFNTASNIICSYSNITSN